MADQAQASKIAVTLPDGRVVEASTGDFPFDVLKGAGVPDIDKAISRRSCPTTPRLSRSSGTARVT